MKPIRLMMAMLALAAWGLSCSQTGQAAQTLTQKKKNLTNIRIKTIQPDHLTETIALSATVLPDRQVTFAAETPGRVEHLRAELGNRVRKGETLARIDYEMLKAQLDQAQASYELAAKTSKRMSQLRAEELASQQQLDEAAAQEQRSRATLQIAKVQLKKSIVRSTLNGFVARKLVEEGEYVIPGQPLLKVVDFSTVVISAQVPENLVAKIRRGMPASVYIASLGLETKGRVHVVVPAAHPGSRTFELRVKAPNPNHKILIGMSSSLRITAEEHSDVVVVPIDTVLDSAGARSVFVEQDGKVERRPVELGPIDGSRVIITRGLSPGDRLVVEGQRDLYDGQPVEVVSTTVPAHASR